MNNENKHTKPNCPLIGEDGNIFHLVGIASKTLKRNGLSEEASEMTNKVFASILDFIKYATRYFFIDQQEYRWKI